MAPPRKMLTSSTNGSTNERRKVKMMRPATLCESRIYKVLRSVPPGQVITFVELADFADLGSGRGPGIAGRVVRQAADALKAGKKRMRHEEDEPVRGRPPMLPWWRVVRGRAEPGLPLEKLLPGPPSRAAEQLHRLQVELGLRRMKAPLERDGLQPPPFAKNYFRDVKVHPAKGAEHSCTLVYLHGYGGKAARYLRKGNGLPWVEGRSGEGPNPFAGLRVVLPTAHRLRQPWGETKPAWYAYGAKQDNTVGDFKSLEATRRRLSALVRAEVAKLGGEGHRVFVGGLSQGCGVALDTYLREAPSLGLGGFLGVAGWVPSDDDGFVGADEAMEGLLASRTQRKRPFWLMLPTDDTKFMPWPFVAASLRRACGRLPGLLSRKVSGRGHGVGDWEGEFLQDFLEVVKPTIPNGHV